MGTTQPTMQKLPWGNIYAPQWMGVSPGLAGYDDREHDVDLPAVTVDAATITQPQPLAIDSDADFLVRDIEFTVLPNNDDTGQPGPLDIRVRIRDGNGRLFTSDFMPIVDLCGPMCPIWPVEKGAVLYVEYQNIGTVDSQVLMVLKGYKRVPCPGRPAPMHSDYVPLYKRYAAAVQNRDLEDFEYPFQFANTTGSPQDQLRIPIQTDNDADFLWRGLAGDWNQLTVDEIPIGTWVTFWDPHNTPLSQFGLTVPWGSQNAGMPQENIFSNGGARMAPQYPEIFVPRGGVIELTMSFPALNPVTGTAPILRGSLRGVKLYDSKGSACR